jgi:transposase
MRAVDLFEEGRLNKAEIARELGVSHQTISDWHELYQKGGREALKSAGRAGRMPKLDSSKLEMIEAELLKGAKSHGYPNELWTLRRVASLIEDMTGVAHHPNHVWRILHDKLERNEEAIEHWVKNTWPAIKKVQGAGAR